MTRKKRKMKRKKRKMKYLCIKNIVVISMSILCFLLLWNPPSFFFYFCGRVGIILHLDEYLLVISVIIIIF